jgi:voltage-gated potassium channel
MNTLPHLNPAAKSLILFLALFIFGTAGYMMIEGWDVIDSMFMTTITLATVGYSEVNAVSPEGRMFTVIVIIFGVSLFLYIAGNTVQFLVEGRIRVILGRRKLEKTIARLSDHYIIWDMGGSAEGSVNILCRKN